MDHSGPTGCETEKRNSTDKESSCSSMGLDEVPVTPNLFGKRFGCHHCNLSFLNYTQLNLHRKTHLFPNKAILNQNKSPHGEREEEDSNITLGNNSAILVYETDYHTGLSMNETSNITEVVVNETDQLLGAEECDTNCQQSFVSETSIQQTMSRNPNIIINETDTINNSSENKTHNPYKSLNRRFVQREYSFDSDLDHVDNTPLAEPPQSRFKINRKKVQKNRQLLFPGKYLKKLPSKKRRERKSSQKSSDVASNENDCSNIICRNSEKLTNNGTNFTTFEKNSKTFRECVNETCYSLVSVDETCINTVMAHYSQVYGDETQNNSVNLMNETSYSQISVDKTLINNPMTSANQTTNSQFSIDETCNNAMMPVNETYNAEVSMEETYITPGDVWNIGEQNKTDLRICENSLNETELVAENININSASDMNIIINSASDMNITINISQRVMNSEIDLESSNKTSFQENVKRGITMRKKGKLHEATNSSVIGGRFESTRAHKFKRSSRMNRRSKSDSELLSFTCMEAISTPQSSTSNDMDKISNFTDTSSNGSKVFEKNHNKRENLEENLFVVGESIGSDNISESFLNEAVMMSRSNLDYINDGHFYSTVIYDRDIDGIEDNISRNQQHRDLSVTNVEEMSNNQEYLQSEEGIDVIRSESSNLQSSSGCAQPIHQARSIQDATSTGGIIMAQNIEDQKDFDSENEVSRELNPIEWLDREHRRFIQDWCIGIEKTEFKCKYCEEVCESHDQLSIHVHFKHIMTRY